MRLINKLLVLSDPVFTKFRVLSRAKCGHDTKLRGVIKYGHTKRFKSVPRAKDGQPTHCLKCMEEKLVRCAWCQGPIVFGDTINMRQTAMEFIPPAESAGLSTDDNRTEHIICQRETCIPTKGADTFRYGIAGEDPAVGLMYE